MLQKVAPAPAGAGASFEATEHIVVEFQRFFGNGQRELAQLGRLHFVLLVLGGDADVNGGAGYC